MSYTEEAVRAKLSALNESTDSIVSVAQWIMFHRRYADKTAQLWLERIKDSNPAKRVNLFYLANEVAQQSKTRRKDDFLNAFSPILLEATTVALKGAPADVQIKIKRTVEVWRQRQIFDTAVQDALEARIAESEKQRPSGSKKALGGALFSADSSVPAEVQAIVTAQQSLSKIHLNMTPLVSSVQKDHASLITTPDTSKPPRIYAAQLGALVKALANAESAVSESLTKRNELILDLQKQLDANRNLLAEEKSLSATLKRQREEVETQHRTVENSILPGSTGAEFGEQNGHSTAQADNEDIQRPESERFTPPPVEPLSPPPAPLPEAAPLAAEDDQIQSTTPIGTPPPSAAIYHSPPTTHTTAFVPSPIPDRAFEPTDLAASAGVLRRPSSDIAATAAANAIPPALKPVNGTKTAGSPDIGLNRGIKRRRKSDNEFEAFNFGSGEDAMEGLDEEVVGMLG